MNYFFCFFSSSLCFGRITCSILRLVCGHVVLRQTPTIGFHQPAKRLPSRCHSVLGIPIPNSLAFWASPSHITAAFWASPGTLPGCPNPQCFGHPLQKNAGFRGKIENVLEMASAKYRNLFQYLKKKVYPERFTKQKTTLRKFAKKFEYDSKLESLFYVAKEENGTALR